MKHVARCGFAVCAFLACSNSGHAQAPASRAQEVIMASKQATGGAAWDMLEGCYEEGTHADGRISYRTWFSMRRYGMRMESDKDGSTRSIGFNGRNRWQRNGTGAVEVSNEEAALVEAITTAYVSSNGFFFPERFPADFRYLRETAHGGRKFDVVEIAPKGGRPAEYWFDQDSHFLSRVVDTQESPPVAFEASDYRRAGEVSVAFNLSRLGPDGAVVDQGVLTSLSCRSVDAALFDPPVEP
jgi:hypothetical protein